MKVFFDTNVYVAEALLGGAAERMVAATISASWRIFCSGYVLDETERVLADKLGFTRRLARLTRMRARRRVMLIATDASRHFVPEDPADSPVLCAAIKAGVDYLVTNDAHLLALSPYESIRIVSMDDYYNELVNEGHINL